jgi:hypothetical protein
MIVSHMTCNKLHFTLYLHVTLCSSECRVALKNMKVNEELEQKEGKVTLRKRGREVEEELEMLGRNA